MFVTVRHLSFVICHTQRVRAKPYVICQELLAERLGFEQRTKDK